MTTVLSTELYWLILTILMTSLFWIPYIINRMLEQGVFNALWDPHGITTTKVAWANRMMQAHHNAVENLILFAALVFAIQLGGMNSEITATACKIYFFARLTHYLAFSLAIPLLRVVTFLTGFGVQIILALQLLR